MLSQRRGLYLECYDVYIYTSPNEATSCVIDFLLLDTYLQNLANAHQNTKMCTMSHHPLKRSTSHTQTRETHKAKRNAGINSHTHTVHKVPLHDRSIFLLFISRVFQYKSITNTNLVKNLAIRLGP